MENSEKDLKSKPLHPNTEESEPITIKVIKSLLQEAGLAQYDPEVVTHLADYMDFYISNLVEQATAHMKHANRTEMSKADVQLAIHLVEKKAPKRLSQKELIEMGREHNKTQLPNIFQKEGRAIPNCGIVLQETNYRMKSPYAPTPKYPMSYPLMDIMNRQNQMIALNTIKRHQGLTTLLRPPTGHPPISVGLPPQRIIIKPKTPAAMINICGQKFEERRVKFYEMPKK